MENSAKSIRVTMTAAMVFCTVITAAIIGVIAVFGYRHSFDKKLEDNMSLISRSYANGFDLDIKAVEHSVKIVRSAIENGFDPEKLKENPGDYLNKYEGEMELLIGKVAEDTNSKTGIDIKSGVQAIYFTMNPDIVGRAYEIWYADEDGDCIRALDESRIMGMIWDVSGKGVTAALGNYAFHVMSESVMSKKQDVVEVLRKLNLKMCKGGDDMFVAACCFSLDFEKGMARVAGAGINQFIYKRAKHGNEEVIVRGPFLGMFEESEFEERQISFASNDRFYFYTDGVEFMLEDDPQIVDAMGSLPIVHLKGYLNTKWKNLDERGGVKDDCTFVALEIK